MQGIHDAAESGTYHEMESTFERPEPMPMNQPEYVFSE